MVRSIKKSKKRRRKNALLLRARLVDRHGALLRPSDVEWLRFAIVEPGQVAEEDQLIAVLALDPTEVVLDGLRNDNDWAVDVCGYNFCHYIDVKGLDLARLPPQCELRYFLRDTTGEVSIIRFSMGAVEYD